MVVKKLLIVSLWFVLFSAANEVRAQCTTLGQTPATAFPVCGSSIFKQTSVPACVNGNIPTHCPADGNQYQDLNPYWYKFTCFVSGTLGLTISPNNLGDDYDWQIFDVTGHNPIDVYTDATLIVSCNWSGLTGITGTSASAISLMECGSITRNPTGPPIFSKMPQLIQGHNYLLLISHFTGDAQSGYALAFAGGTALITDTLQPAMKTIQPICDGSQLGVVMNKNMTCSSLAADGTDFSVTSAAGVSIPVTGAFAASCSSGFDMDSLVVTLGGPLPPGNYTLTVKTGSDGNTLLDNCGTPVPDGVSLPFVMVAPRPTSLDSLTPPSCAPDTLQLVFKTPIHCSSIASDGSDFSVTGPYPVTVTGASGLCDANDLTYTIRVKLSAPLLKAGNFSIRLAPGSDGNTLFDVCGLATPPAALSFSVLDTVSAVFNDKILYGCRSDTIRYNYPENNGVNKWTWIFDGTDTVRQEYPPQRIYAVPDSSVGKTAQLIVSNGFCNDTAMVSIPLDNYMHPQFEAPNILCPQDYAKFQNNSSGNILSWEWQFGDGSSSSLQVPPDHLYPATGVEAKYTVYLIVSNGHSCQDTAVQSIDVLRSCYIAVPSAFTPNGDGLNDYLYPLNAYKADNLQFRVYNRYGQMVFETNDWTKKWDGTINGHTEPAGTFVWTLRYTDRDSGKKFFLKGTTILIR